jgi:hypothetical protein
VLRTPDPRKRGPVQSLWLDGVSVLVALEEQFPGAEGRAAQWYKNDEMAMKSISRAKKARLLECQSIRAGSDFLRHLIVETKEFGQAIPGTISLKDSRDETTDPFGAHWSL